MRTSFPHITKLIIALVLAACINPLFADQTTVLYLKDGTQLQCSGAFLQGDEVVVKVQYGSLKFDKGVFTDASLNQIITGNFQAPLPPPPLPKPVAPPKPAPLPNPAPPVLAPVVTTTTFPAPPPPHPAPVAAAVTPPAPPAPPKPPPTIILASLDSIDGSNTASSSNTPTPPIPPLPDALPPEPSLPTDQKYTVKTVEYDYPGYGPSKVPVKVQALVPQDTSGAVPPSASKMVFFAPPLGAPNLLIPEDSKIGSDSNRMFWELAQVYGMTVFTARYPATIQDVQNRNTCYYYPESGAFELALNVRKKLITDYNLKTNPMYIIGVSGGGSMAEHWPLVYPDDVASVAMIGAHYLDTPTKNLNVPFLVINTRDDITTDNNLKFISAARHLGTPVLYVQTPPAADTKKDYEGESGQFFHHRACTLAYSLLEQFTVAVALSDNPSEIAKWPLRAKIDMPFDTYAVKDAPADDRPQRTLYFPSDTFAALWKRVPYRQGEIDQTPGNPFSVTVRYPKDKPLGVVILEPDMDANPTNFDDWLDFLAIEGYVAVDADFGDDDPSRLARTKALLTWVLSRDEFKNLKVGLIGFGTGGRHCFLATAQNKSDRIMGVGTVDAPMDCPVPELSPILSLDALVHPALLGYSNSMTTPDLDRIVAQAQRSNKAVQAVDLSKVSPKLWSFEVIELLLSKLVPETN